MKNEVRSIDANALARKIREYMDDFPNAKTRLETCQVVLSMLGDEGQTPTLTDHFPDLTKMVLLTLEQLRRMDGQPVWYKDKNQWFIVELHHPVFGSCVINSDGCYIPLEKAVKRGFYAYPIAHIDREAWTAEWKEYTGADAGFHYCSKCKQQAFNYEDGGEVVEVLSDFCPGCARAMTEKGLSELEKRMGLA